jgi:4-alpha-glucanotransferase
VAFTGTHDNDTARGWFAALPEADRAAVLRSLGSGGREVEWDMIRAALESPAARAIVPVQDVLGLGSEARMNTPSRTAGNWEFRVTPGALTRDRASRLRSLVEASGRLEPR